MTPPLCCCALFDCVVFVHKSSWRCQLLTTNKSSNDRLRYVVLAFQQHCCGHNVCDRSSFWNRLSKKLKPLLIVPDIASTPCRSNWAPLMMRWAIFWRDYQLCRVKVLRMGSMTLAIPRTIVLLTTTKPLHQPERARSLCKSKSSPHHLFIHDIRP